MPSDPISPPPVSGGGRFELPAYLSNGIVGLRVSEVALTGGIAMVSGFSGEDPVKQIEAAVQAPYPLAGDISINGVVMSATGHAVQADSQSYDFSRGELTTLFAFHVEGVEARIEVLTFCSRRQPSIVCQEICLETDKVCDLVLSAGIEMAGLAGQALRSNKDSPGGDAPIDGSVRWQAPGGMSTCGLAYVIRVGRRSERRAQPVATLGRAGDTPPFQGQASAALPVASDHERRPGCVAWAAGNAGVALGRHGAAPGFRRLAVGQPGRVA